MNKINKIITVYGVFIIAAAFGAYLTLPDSGVSEILPAQTSKEEIATEKGHRPAKDYVDANAVNRTRTRRIPAHFHIPPEKNSLPPVMNPERFTGRALEAYLAVAEIPETIAQLPCFCFCDESFKHRSLHSCFEDEHANRCLICINEALAAHRLQTEEKLSPEQIRERLIAHYAK